MITIDELEHLIEYKKSEIKGLISYVRGEKNSCSIDIADDIKSRTTDFGPRMKDMLHSSLDSLEEMIEMGPPHVRIKAVQMVVDYFSDIESRNEEGEMEHVIIYLPEKEEKGGDNCGVQTSEGSDSFPPEQ